MTLQLITPDPVQLVKATRHFKLGDGRIEVLAFGRATGNWAMPKLTRHECVAVNPGIGQKIAKLIDLLKMEDDSLRDLRTFSPIPSFNGLIGKPADLTEDCWFPGFWRGTGVEGASLSWPATAIAIATGDCKTIVAWEDRCGAAIVAHAGLDSLVDRALIDGRNSRPRFPNNVVEVVVSELVAQGAKRQHIKAAALVGIAGRHFENSWDFQGSGYSGDSNKRLTEYLLSLAVRFGDDIIVGPPKDGCINLNYLIRYLCLKEGVPPENIVYDNIDTFSDTDNNGLPVWHSARRNRGTPLQSNRNLVLAIKRK